VLEVLVADVVGAIREMLERGFDELDRIDSVFCHWALLARGEIGNLVSRRTRRTWRDGTSETDASRRDARPRRSQSPPLREVG